LSAIVNNLALSRQKNPVLYLIKKMKAVILAAGRGKRMEELTEELSKPLLKVGDKTLLSGIIDTLPPSAVEEIIIIIGYLGEKIKEHCRKYYSDRKIIFVEQKELSGTAGAVLLARPYIREGERFAIIYGDEKTTKEQMARCFSYEFSWLCREMSDPSQSGVATISGDGRIIEVIEKPKILYLRPEIKKAYPIKEILATLYDVDERADLPEEFSSYYAIIVNDMKAKDLEDTIIILESEIVKLKEAREKIEKDIGLINQKLKKSVRGLETIRFNPFPDQGSNQSFAIGILNEEEDGVVISSLYSRERMSIFAKPIKAGKSTYELTEEEKEVLKKAKV